METSIFFIYPLHVECPKCEFLLGDNNKAQGETLQVTGVYLKTLSMVNVVWYMWHAHESRWLEYVHVKD